MSTACAPAPEDVGVALEARQLRDLIIQKAEQACDQLGPSPPMILFAKSRLTPTLDVLPCMSLVLARDSVGLPVNPRSREEAEAPLAEHIRRMGQSGLAIVRPAVEDPDRSEGERHLAIWALASIVSNQRPFPSGKDETRCLLDQWQSTLGEPLAAHETLASFESWPPLRPAPDPGGTLDPEALNPPLPAPFDRPYLTLGDTVSANPELEKRLSQELFDLLQQRREILQHAESTLRALTHPEPSRLQMTKAQWQEVEAALGAIRILRPQLDMVDAWVLPLLEEDWAETFPSSRDAVRRTMEAFGVELLPTLKQGLSSDDLRQQRLLLGLLHSVVGGDVGVDCLLRSWAESSTLESDAARFEELRSQRGN